MKSWCELPIEILTIVFDQVNFSIFKDDISQCVLVCKNWKTTAQRLMYSSAELASKTDFDTFINTVINNKQVGLEKSVKDVTFDFQLGSLSDHQIILNTVANYLPYIINIHVECNLYDFYLALLYSYSDSKFKNLERIPRPDDKKDMGIYNACALVYKNQFTSLTVSDQLQKGLNDPNLSLSQYNLLFDRLDQFPQLTSIRLEKKATAVTETLDSAVEKCRILKKLDFEFYRVEGELDMEGTLVHLSLYQPRPDIKDIEGILAMNDYDNLLRYIIHKYPQLKSLILNLEKCNQKFTNSIVATQFIHYLVKIPKHILYISVKLDLVAQVLEKYWKLSSGNRLQNVRIQYENVALERNDVYLYLDRKHYYVTWIKYRNPQDLPHLNDLEKIGSIKN